MKRECDIDKLVVPTLIFVDVILIVWFQYFFPVTETNWGDVMTAYYLIPLVIVWGLVLMFKPSTNNTNGFFKVFVFIVCLFLNIFLVMLLIMKLYLAYL